MHVTAAVIQTQSGHCYAMRAEGLIATVFSSIDMPSHVRKEITAFLRARGFDDVVFSRGVPEEQFPDDPRPIIVDEAQRLLIFADGETRSITKSEAAILNALMRAMPRPVHRDALVSKLYGMLDPPLDADNTINVFVSKIRRKIRHYASIKAIYGEGYSISIL